MAKKHPSCLFPSLHGPARSEGSWIPIPVEASCFSENDIYALAVATWALVLHRYVNLEEVAFIIHRSRRQDTSTVRIPIQPEEPVKLLLDTAKATAQTLSESHHDSLNSGIVLSSSHTYAKEAFQSAKCEIGLVIDGEALYLWSIFSEKQADLVASSVAQALHTISENPEQLTGAVTIFSDQHHEQISKWNAQHEVRPPPAKSIYELVQPLSRSQQGAQAIISWDGEAIISMLSVIRTGAAVVFLEPSHPPPHRDHVLSLARPVLILASPLQERLFKGANSPTITICSDLMSKLPPTPWGSFKAPNSPADPVFLIFTSGSSGTPKGCVIDHGSLAGMIPAENWPFNKTCNRIFQFAPFVVGTFVLEVFSAFLIGGILCLSSDHEWRNDLVGSINRMKVSALVLPPSLAKIVSPEMIPTVRMLALGGEPLDRIIFDRWGSSVRIFQGYGMSENAGSLTFNDVSETSDPRNVGQSPTGRLWLVNPDDHHQLAPIGTIAEILYEGPGVAREYLHHPEKSAATFVDPPSWLYRFNGIISGQGRFLKTGDLARYNTDGTINHFGRKDSQVKIRGQRIDLREVELSIKPYLDSTMDVFVERVLPKNSSPMLAAFLWSKDTRQQGPVSDHGFSVMSLPLLSQVKDIDASLRSTIPNYMVPTVYLLLATLPTTITGKVDRRNMRDTVSGLHRTELESLMHQQASEMISPATPMEHQIALLIAQTLRIELHEVGMNTSFLKLGGDSITAMDFVRRCRNERVKITLQDIFQEPTVGSLALRALDVKIPENSNDDASGGSSVMALLRTRISEELSREGWTDGYDLPSIQEDFNPKHTCGQTITLDNEPSSIIFGNSLKSLHIQPWHVILAALMQSFSTSFSDREPLSLATKIHGRDEMISSCDFSPTAECFGSFLLYAARDDFARISALDLLRQIKDRSWLSHTKGQVLIPAAVGNVDIVFHNHISSSAAHEGRQCCQFDREETEVVSSSRFIGLLEVFASTIDESTNTLELSYKFSESLGSPGVLEKWFSNFQKSIVEILEQLKKTATLFSLSDFPFLSLNYKELRSLENEHLPKIGITSQEELCGAYPCSSMQEGILLAQAIDPRRYKIHTVWRATLKSLQKPVCIERLRDAWDVVVQRHPTLRTAFSPHPSHGAKHIQFILKPAKSGSFANIVDSLENEPRKLCTNSMPRLTLQQESGGTVICLLEIDHTVIDGLSLSIVMRDLAAAYDGNLHIDYAAPLQPRSIETESQSAEDAKRYWTTLLRNRSPCLFPAMNSEVELHSRTATFHAVDVDIGPLSSGLYDLSRQHGVTVSNIFQIAWALVLRAFTGQNSVCFGYMVSGRDSSKEIWNSVGLYANMIIRTIDLDGQKILLDILRESQMDFVKSLPYQHISPLEIFGDLEVTSQQLFNTMVSFTNQKVDNSASKSSLSLQVVEALDYYEYDVTLEGSVQDGYINARVKFWDSNLNHDQAQGLAGTFRRAIDLLLTSGQKYMSEVCVLSVEDEREIMEWNSCPPARVNSVIHEYIDARCMKQPLAQAICAWNGSFTYQELSSFSSRLAAYLCGSGIDPGTIVPVCFEKSRWTSVAMLAALKAGCAFMLLNPSLPLQRLQDICQAISAQTILTSRENAALSAKLGQNLIVVDDEENWNNDSTTIDWKPPTMTGDDTAYVVFTSGSTGAPKGVMIHHSAYLTSSLCYGPALNLSSGSRVLQSVSHSFDISISDHLATLLAGGCLCVPSDAELKTDFASAFETYNANWAMMTPSVSRIFKPDSVPTLKTLCLIGEALSASDVVSWSKNVRLMNTYGPAEAACVSHGHLNVKVDQDSKNIGKGLGVISWIVDQDDHERLLPIGAVGELLIDGPIVGKGYINNPDKTNAAFIDCPSWMSRFRPGYNAKIYKTGDLVRYMNDGSILFCGRKNTQIKIRGQWVELSEVENYSRKCFPGASHIVVDFVSDSSTLVGFVPWDENILDAVEKPGLVLLSASSKFQAEASAARKRMLDLVPDHMVPAAFIPVNRIPLGPTGKSDRGQIREMLNSMSPEDMLRYTIGSDEKVMPSNDLEGKLQMLYASIIGVPVDTISVTDDFLHVGGNSLIAMKISSRARADGLQIGFADIFTYRTIRQLAINIQQNKPVPNSIFVEKSISTPWMKEIMLEPKVEAVLPCTPLQEMMLRTQSHRPEVYTISFSAQVTSKSSNVDAKKLQKAFQAVVSRHTSLRTYFVTSPNNDSHAQVILNTEAALSMDNIGEGSSSPHEMVKFPYQISFVQVSPSTVTVIGHMSHAVGDAASTTIILDEMSSIYKNEHPRAPAPEFKQYVDYIQNSSSSAIAYWQDYLNGASSCLLPSKIAKDRGQLQNLQVNMGPTFREIHEFCQQSKQTVPILIKSVLALTLAFFSRSDSICFGYLSSGRDAHIPGIEAMVGPLLGLLICRINLEPFASLQSIMEAIPSDYLQSFAQYSGTVQALQQVEKELSGPLFNTLVNHRQSQSLDSRVIGNSDLSFELVSQSDPMDFDLVVLVDETPRELKVSLNYWDSCISESTAASIASTFDAIMSYFVTDGLSRPSHVLESLSKA